MAVVTINSTIVTAYDTLPQNQVINKLAGGSIKERVGIIEAVSGNSIASIYRAVRLKSSDRVSRVLLSCDAITTCAGDIGIYDVAANGGAVVDVDFFASAQSLATALVNSDIGHEADAADGAAGFGLSDTEKMLWEALGLTADPVKFYDVAVTLTAAAGSAGTIVLRVQYLDGN